MASIIINYRLFWTQRKKIRNEIRPLNGIRKCRCSVLIITMVDSVETQTYPLRIKCLQLYKLQLRQQE